MKPINWRLEMIGSRLIFILAALLSMTATIHAVVIPGRWEKVDGLTPGTETIVELRAGERIDRSLKHSGPEDLTLIELGGSERRIPKSEVSTISYRQKHADSLSNGALIGFGVGTVLGLVGCVTPPYPPDKETLFIGPLAFGGIGAAIGPVADAAHQANEVLYKAQ
jgi:hypothetical protein